MEHEGTADPNDVDPTVIEETVVFFNRNEYADSQISRISLAVTLIRFLSSQIRRDQVILVCHRSY